MILFEKRNDPFPEDQSDSGADPLRGNLYGFGGYHEPEKFGHDQQGGVDLYGGDEPAGFPAFCHDDEAASGTDGGFG